MPGRLCRIISFACSSWCHAPVDGNATAYDGVCAVNFNKKHKRVGHLFQNRYKSIVVEEDSYFLELVRYIHLNPIKAGMVKSVAGLAHYRYTGHSVILGKRDYPVQDVDEVLGRFSDRRPSACRNTNPLWKQESTKGRERI